MGVRTTWRQLTNARASFLSGRGKALLDRFERTGEMAQLDASIVLLRKAVTAAPPDQPDLLGMLTLAGALWSRFDRTATTADLAEALRLSRTLLAVVPADNPGRAGMLYVIGTGLRHRFERTGELADLDDAVESGRQAVAATPADDPDLAERLSSLRRALLDRHRRTGVVADLVDAVEAGRDAVAATPADSPEFASVLTNLGVVLRTQFERTGVLADLDEAIQVGRQAVAMTPADYPARADRLSSLGRALIGRFDRTGMPADLEEAVLVGREAVAGTPTPDADLVGRLTTLGVALRTRFDRTGALVDLDEAIAVLRKAVYTSPPDYAHQAVLQSNLGTALRTRFERTGQSADLDQGIQLLSEAITATPTDHPDQLRLRFSSGAALLARFERAGATTDLDDAIGYLRQALAATSADHPDLSERQTRLGHALLTRFERTGATADLDEAVQASRQAVVATASDDPVLPGKLTVLASALVSRFQRAGGLADLDEALGAIRQAVSATPTDHPHLAGRLNNLGITLSIRYERSGSIHDLNEAVVAFREAVDATAPDHPDLADMLSSLGIALRIRFEQTGVLADADEAVQAGRRAVAACPADRPDRARKLSNLSVSLWKRAKPTERKADLDEAVLLGREAVATTPRDHPDQAIMCTNLGSALWVRFQQSDEPADLAEAIAAYEDAVTVGIAEPSARIRAARAAAELAAAAQPGRAAGFLEQAVRLLPEVTPRQLQRSDQQYALGGYAGLAADAAALALGDPGVPVEERPTSALRLLEAGRAVLLSQALHVRSDVTELAEQHPDLADDFVRLRDLLDRTSDAAPTLIDVPESETDRRRLAHEFDEVLARIRAEPGFESFALPPSIDELVAQADQGPVVVFNISSYRSDALLLTATGITCLPLPGLSVEAVSDQVRAFHNALHTASTGRTLTDRRNAQQQLSRILEWLWDNAAGPVLDTLGHHRRLAPDRSGPRVWWIPGGLLGQLPVHAAGYHTDPPDPAARTVLDRVISSYTPTVAALHHARQRISDHNGSEAPDVFASDGHTRALIVAMPTTPGAADLRHVPEEARMVAARLPGAITLTEPGTDLPAHSSTMPTSATVLNRLADFPIVHFACHGATDPADPSRSHLLLHDHETAPLTVAALATIHLDHARLAYLSACDTALNANTELIDEAIHLASACQLAGYPHVIGTLWTIDDEISVHIADAFYTELTANQTDPRHAASALHHAVRAVRDTLPGTPSLWAAYLHAGA